MRVPESGTARHAPPARTPAAGELSAPPTPGSPAAGPPLSAALPLPPSGGWRPPRRATGVTQRARKWPRTHFPGPGAPPAGCRGRGCLPRLAGKGLSVRSGPLPRLCPQARPGTYLSVLGLQGGQELRQLSPVLCLHRCCSLGSNKEPVTDARQRRLLGRDPDQGGARNPSPNTP